MSQKSLVQMPTPTGVQNNQTLTWMVNRGLTYHTILLNMGGNNVSSFGEVRVNINGQTRIKALASEIDTMNQFDGLLGADACGQLIINFDRIGLLSVGGREMTAIDTGVVNKPMATGKMGIGVTSFNIEIDVGTLSNLASITLNGVTQPAGSNSGSTATTKLTGKALVSKSNNVGSGTIKLIDTQNRTTSVSGITEISDLFMRPNELYLNRFFVKLSGSGTPVLNRLTVRRNNYDLFDVEPLLSNMLHTNGVKSPQSGWYVFDTTYDGDGSNVIDLQKAQDMRLVLDVSSAANIRIVKETIGVL